MLPPGAGNGGNSRVCVVGLKTVPGEGPLVSEWSSTAGTSCPSTHPPSGSLLIVPAWCLGLLTWADDPRGSQAWASGPESSCRSRADLRRSRDEAAPGARTGARKLSAIGVCRRQTAGPKSAAQPRPSGQEGCFRSSGGAPPAGFEPAHTAPEATSRYHTDLHKCTSAQVRGVRLGRRSPALTGQKSDQPNQYF